VRARSSASCANAASDDGAGDRVTLRRGKVIVGFENRGRSPHGEIEDVYRFVHGRYPWGAETGSGYGRRRVLPR
jgi:hypothetical protein